MDFVMSATTMLAAIHRCSAAVRSEIGNAFQPVSASTVQHGFGLQPRMAPTRGAGGGAKVSTPKPRSLARLSMLDPAVVVLPGHNYAELPFTTIGVERAQNDNVIMGLQQVPRPPPLPPCLACDNRGNCGPKGFIIGRKVRIRGLGSAAGKALNGQPAVVQTFLTDKERYAVRLFASSEVKSLKADNLEKLARGERCDAPEPISQELGC